uniref:Uncharacterized protein n=1 Tax=Panagrolaimus sp. ES5 TaxID=591445 RepID=A0AC34GCS4_9BILA
MTNSAELSWLGITPERINEIQRNKKLSEVLTKIVKLAKSLNCPSKDDKAEQPYRNKKLSEVLTKIVKLAKSLNCPSKDDKAGQPY